MSDRELRDLERRAKGGDEESRQRLAYARGRAGLDVWLSADEVKQKLASLGVQVDDVRDDSADGSVVVIQTWSEIGGKGPLERLREVQGLLNHPPTAASFGFSSFGGVLRRDMNNYDLGFEMGAFRKVTAGHAGYHGRDPRQNPPGRDQELRALERRAYDSDEDFLRYSAARLRAGLGPVTVVADEVRHNDQAAFNVRVYLFQINPKAGWAVFYDEGAPRPAFVRNYPAAVKKWQMMGFRGGFDATTAQADALARRYAEERILGHPGQLTDGGKTNPPGRDDAINAAFREWQAGDDASLERLMAERARAGLSIHPTVPGVREMDEAARNAGWRTHGSAPGVWRGAMTVLQAQAAIEAELRRRGWAPDPQAQQFAGRGRTRARAHTVWISPDAQERITFARTNVVVEKGGRGRWTRNYLYHTGGVPLQTIAFARRLLDQKMSRTPTREEWTTPMQNPPGADNEMRTLQRAVMSGDAEAGARLISREYGARYRGGEHNRNAGFGAMILRPKRWARSKPQTIVEGLTKKPTITEWYATLIFPDKYEILREVKSKKAALKLPEALPLPTGFLTDKVLVVEDLAGFAPGFAGHSKAYFVDYPGLTAKVAATKAASEARRAALTPEQRFNEDMYRMTNPPDRDVLYSIASLAQHGRTSTTFDALVATTGRPPAQVALAVRQLAQRGLVAVRGPLVLFDQRVISAAVGGPAVGRKANPGSDERMRVLQRAAAGGDAEALQRLAMERQRTGVRRVKLTLQRLRDTGEWRVNYWVNGKRDEGKSYYTDDKADAVQTMADMQRRIDSGEDRSENPGADERRRAAERAARRQDEAYGRGYDSEAIERLDVEKARIGDHWTYYPDAATKGGSRSAAYTRHFRNEHWPDLDVGGYVAVDLYSQAKKGVVKDKKTGKRKTHYDLFGGWVIDAHASRADQGRSQANAVWRLPNAANEHDGRLTAAKAVEFLEQWVAGDDSAAERLRALKDATKAPERSSNPGMAVLGWAGNPGPKGMTLAQARRRLKKLAKQGHGPMLDRLVQATRPRDRDKLKAEIAHAFRQKNPGSTKSVGKQHGTRWKTVSIETAISRYGIDKKPGFKEALAHYRKFHKADPHSVRICTRRSTGSSNTSLVVTDMGEVPETQYVVKAGKDSNKAGHHWVHKHREKGKGTNPSLVFDPVSGTMMIVGGTYKVTDWIRN